MLWTLQPWFSPHDLGVWSVLGPGLIESWNSVSQEDEERDVQDQLVELLQYDNFPLIKELMRNRTVVVWCQRLARSQNDSERSRIEVCL